MMINTKMTPFTIRRGLVVAGLALSLSATAGAAMAQRFGFGGGYPQQTGAEIYKGICQGCHMPDAKGAKGAGVYPALAGDRKLTSKYYPILVVLHGQKAMPDFAAFSDVQVANVVNYIRGNFGNSYKDAVTPDEVKAMRATASKPTPAAAPPRPGTAGAPG